MPPFFDQIEPIVLRESIRARVSVAPASMIATFSSIFLYIPFLLSQDVASTQIALWALPITVLMLIRGALSNVIKRDLDHYSGAQMHKADRALRASSIVNQVTVGLGIWIVQSPSPDAMVIPLFMTLIVVIWSIGVLANLFSDFPTFIMSVPLMIGETAFFWLRQDGIGISIGLSMLLAAVLMVILARRGSIIFRDSVLMRFEKDQLLKTVETERENTQRALREALLANESKTYFMAAASHDIKQPLLALGLVTDTMLMSDPPASAIPLLTSQRNSISQMSDHFDALMDMGRFENGHFELHPTRFRLGVFADRINSEIAPMCAEKGLRWTLTLDDVMVCTDEELLLRLLRNLLVNAVHFTSHGQVTCTAKAHDDCVQFTVADTGCGIAKADQKAIFGEFVRLKHDGVRSPGAGLGLSIVEKINRALDLGLTLTSTDGEGTQFTFQLPIITDA